MSTWTESGRSKAGGEKCAQTVRHECGYTSKMTSHKSKSELTFRQVSSTYMAKLTM